MKGNHFQDFIDSINNFDNLSKTQQIMWLVFYKIEIGKYEYVCKADIKPLFSSAWVEEPKNFNQFWSYLSEKKKILIRKGNGFVLSRRVFKELQKSYLLFLPKSKIKKGLKKTNKVNVVTIPQVVLKLFPRDLIHHCDELNENLGAGNWISSMLLMRKILPLSIIRKFQKDNKECDIKKSNGEYLDSKELLEKTKNLIQPRTYRELKEIKFLFDGIQHNFIFTPGETDISPAIIRLRVFLEELFK